MNVQGLIQDDNAVSPVIGVILMVAITVILAAVIASFVLGLGEEAANTTPQASIGFDFTHDNSGDDQLVVTHESGDTISASNLNASVSGARDYDYSGSTGDTNVIFGPGPDNSDGNLFTSSGDVAAGTSYTVDANDFADTGGSSNVDSLTNNLDLREATLRVTYNDPSTDQSSTLQTWTGPEA
jgi:flagellin-like protein